MAVFVAIAREAARREEAQEEQLFVLVARRGHHLSCVGQPRRAGPRRAASRCLTLRLGCLAAAAAPASTSLYGGAAAIFLSVECGKWRAGRPGSRVAATAAWSTSGEPSRRRRPLRRRGGAPSAPRSSARTMMRSNQSSHDQKVTRPRTPTPPRRSRHSSGTLVKLKCNFDFKFKNDVVEVESPKNPA